MFQNRPHYWVAGPVIKGVQAVSRIGGTRLGKKIEGGTATKAKPMTNTRSKTTTASRTGKT